MFAIVFARLWIPILKKPFESFNQSQSGKPKKGRMTFIILPDCFEKDRKTF
jgi:hypothetical protein